MSDGSALAAVGDTPVIMLDGMQPAEAGSVWVKWEGGNPTGSMKDRMAVSVVEHAEADGALAPGQRVVELTGGSTGSSLALVCGVKGYPLSIVTADCFAEEKIRAMRALGADVEVRATPEGRVYPGLVDDLEGRVTEIIEETGAYYTDQFNNPHVPLGYRGLGEELLEACPGVTDFVMAVGTGGCAMGTARVLKEHRPAVRVTLVEPAESPVLSGGEPGAHGVEGIALGFEPPLLDASLYDDVAVVPEAAGRVTARELAATEGVFAGASTGLNVEAAVRVARDRGPDAVVVTVAVDTGLKYLDGPLYRGAP